MDPGVRHVGQPVDLRLSLQEGLVLALHVGEDWVPAAAVVHGITKAGSVHDGQREVDAALLEEDIVGLHCDCLLQPLRGSRIC